MLVKDLTGKEYELNVTKKKSRGRKKSDLFEEVLYLFKELFPTTPHCLEVGIKIKPGMTLYLDIFIPLLHLVIEVHGKQHYQFTPHYHKHKHRFGRSCLNDSLKKEWCEINHIRYLELKYDESREQWADKLRAAIR